MDKYELSLVPTICPETLNVEQYQYMKTRIDKDTKQPYDERNNEIIVSADMVFSWINNENPDERIAVPWILVGQQADSSQAFGSALTYSMRYFLLKYFNIATPEDDVDKWRSKQRAAEAAEDKAIAEQVITQLDGEIRAFLSEHPKDGDKVKTLVSKYVKNGNYLAISESVLATKLLADFRNTFLQEVDE